MSRQNSGFRSRSEYEKDEALCCRYGKIGIPAVAAAQTVLHHEPPASGSQTLNATGGPGDTSQR